MIVAGSIKVGYGKIAKPNSQMTTSIKRMEIPKALPSKSLDVGKNPFGPITLVPRTNVVKFGSSVKSEIVAVERINKNHGLSLN